MRTTPSSPFAAQNGISQIARTAVKTAMPVACAGVSSSRQRRRSSRYAPTAASMAVRNA